MPSMISRIRKGAALLDKKRKSKAWRKKIDLDRLDMQRGLFLPNVESSCGCVLAQLYGTASLGSVRLGMSTFEERFTAGADAGFYAHRQTSDDTKAYAALTRAWKRYLRA